MATFQPNWTVAGDVSWGFWNKTGGCWENPIVQDLGGGLPSSLVPSFPGEKTEVLPGCIALLPSLAGGRSLAGISTLWRLCSEWASSCVEWAEVKPVCTISRYTRAPSSSLALFSSLRVLAVGSNPSERTAFFRRSL